MLSRPDSCASGGVARAEEVVLGLATRWRPEEGLVLGSGYVERWQQLRADLEKRRQARRHQRRFRHNPVTYLKKLEELALQLSLLS